jgi:cbb3-type cytochrome oxidase subunit 1
MKEIIVRFVVGGVVVSGFALLADLLKPKSFAGLFGAAPSVALATLALTVAKQGKEYASVEARSMLIGAIAFFVYALVVSRLLIRRKLPVIPVTGISMTVWFACAFGCWYAVLR